VDSGTSTHETSSESKVSIGANSNILFAVPRGEHHQPSDNTSSSTCSKIGWGSMALAGSALTAYTGYLIYSGLALTEIDPRFFILYFLGAASGITMTTFGSMGFLEVPDRNICGTVCVPDVDVAPEHAGTCCP
jgi:hypothetical protein